MKTFRLIDAKTIILSIIIVISSCCKDRNPVEIVKPEVCATDRWQVIYQSSELYFNCISFLNKDTGYVGAITIAEAFQQYIFRTIDGGNSWIMDTARVSALTSINQIIPLSFDTILGLGHSVYKSIDYGKTWENIFPSHPDDPIFDICIMDDLDWILADGTLITKTADGGKTWQEVYHFPGMAVFSQLSFPSTNTGYAAAGMYSDFGGYGAIVKTTDGGNSWVLLNPEPWKSKNINLKQIDKLQFLSDQVGFMFVSGSLYKTADGGNDWLLINDKVSTYSKYLGHFFNEDSGYFSDLHHIYLTKDGGKTWKCDFATDTTSYYNN